MYRAEIDKKIRELIDHIIDKPADEITLDDYTVLRDVRCMESEEDSRERMERLQSLVTANLGVSHG